MESLSNFRLGNRTGRDSLFAFKAVELVLRTLSDYHQHRTVGLAHVPKSGPALLVFNHSLATYDPLLSQIPIYDELQRLLWGVVDRLMFRTPGLGRILHDIGLSDGTREHAVDLLARGELLGVAPGGMREALRDRRRKYQVDWKGRTGFVRVSVLSGAPVILGASPRSDDIFTVYENPVTPWIYSRLRLPAPLFRGLGPTPLPRPIKLTRFFSEPIPPPAGKEKVTEEEIVRHHAYLQDRMNTLMRQALDATAIDGDRG